MLNETKTNGKDRKACNDVATETLKLTFKVIKKDTDGKNYDMFSIVTPKFSTAHGYIAFRKGCMQCEDVIEYLMENGFSNSLRDSDKEALEYWGEEVEEENFCETCGEEMPKETFRFCSQDCHNRAVKKVESELDSDTDYQEVIDEEMAKDKVGEVSA